MRSLSYIFLKIIIFRYQETFFLLKDITRLKILSYLDKQEIKRKVKSSIVREYYRNAQRKLRRYLYTYDATIVSIYNEIARLRVNRIREPSQKRSEKLCIASSLVVAICIRGRL